MQNYSITFEYIQFIATHLDSLNLFFSLFQVQLLCLFVCVVPLPVKFRQHILCFLNRIQYKVAIFQKKSCFWG